MSYIGNTATTQAFTPAIDYFSGNASTTAFTLSKPVASVAQVQVVVNNVAQNPASAYSVSSNTITFTSAPSSGTNNIYVYYTSPITQVIQPGQNTVYPSSLSTTNALYWDTSGNVGIGTTSPRTSKLDVMSATGTQNTSGDNSGLVNITGPNGANGSQPLLVLATNDAMAANIGPAITFQARYITSSTAAATLGYIQCIKENATSNNLQGALTFVPRNSAGNFVEAGRFDSSGQLILKRTAAVNAATIVCSTGQNSRQVSFVNNNNNNEVGYIFCNNDGTTTQYATTSDYRLKENIAPMTGALSVVEQLKPVTYKWKINGADGQGFIAHELQEVVPDCVTGEKDGAETYKDVDGNEQTRPKYQGIDTSFLVATLTAAIQEQQALITALTARIEALENK